MSAGGGAKTAVPARIAPFHTAAMSSELIERMHCICDLHSPDKWQRRHQVRRPAAAVAAAAAAVAEGASSGRRALQQRIVAC